MQPFVFTQETVIHLPQPEVISKIVLFFIEKTGYGIARIQDLIALHGIGTGYQHTTDHFQCQEENEVEKPSYELKEIAHFMVVIWNGQCNNTRLLPGIAFPDPPITFQIYFIRKGMRAMFFNAIPVPRTTARSGSSATCTGSLIFWLMRLSRPRSNAPPPVR